MSDSAPRTSDWWLTTLMVLVHAALWGPVLAFLIVVVPRHDREFRDFGMKLPAISENVITLSRALSEYAFFLPFVFGAALIADGGIILFLRLGLGQRLLSWVWFVLLTLAALLTLFLCWYAIWLPRQQLLEGLSK